MLVQATHYLRVVSFQNQIKQEDTKSEPPPPTPQNLESFLSRACCKGTQGNGNKSLHLVNPLFRWNIHRKSFNQYWCGESGGANLAVLIDTHLQRVLFNEFVCAQVQDRSILLDTFVALLTKLADSGVSQKVKEWRQLGNCRLTSFCCHIHNIPSQESALSLSLFLCLLYPLSLGTCKIISGVNSRKGRCYLERVL